MKERERVEARGELIGKGKKGDFGIRRLTFFLPGERKERLDGRLTGAEAGKVSSLRIVGGGGQRRRLLAPRRIHEKYIECDGNARRTCCALGEGCGIGGVGVVENRPCGLIVD